MEKSCAYCHKPIRSDEPFATIPIREPPYTLYMHLVFTTLKSPPCYDIWLFLTDDIETRN